MNWTVILICAAITIGTFLFWEFVAWFTHKYVMHGFLWVWHKSHHTVHHHVTEKNDFVCDCIQPSFDRPVLLFQSCALQPVRACRWTWYSVLRNLLPDLSRHYRSSANPLASQEQKPVFATYDSCTLHPSCKTYQRGL